MNNFFNQADTFWRRPYGALHLYALPEHETGVLDTYTELTSILSDFTNLAVQPAEFLHVTLRRLEVYEGEEPEGWNNLKSDLTRHLADVSQFELRFDAPVLAPASVAAQAETHDEWNTLQRVVSDSFSRNNLSEVLTPAPAIPHYTLAYSKQKSEKTPVQNALRDSHLSSSMLVKDVCLVSVDQNRETGIFSFRTLEKWPLK